MVEENEIEIKALQGALALDGLLKNEAHDEALRELKRLQDVERRLGESQNQAFDLKNELESVKKGYSKEVRKLKEKLDEMDSQVKDLEASNDAYVEMFSRRR